MKDSYDIPTAHDMALRNGNFLDIDIMMEEVERTLKGIIYCGNYCPDNNTCRFDFTVPQNPSNDSTMMCVKAILAAHGYRVNWDYYEDYAGAGFGSYLMDVWWDNE